MDIEVGYWMQENLSNWTSDWTSKYLTIKFD